MDTQITRAQTLALAFAAAWNRLEKQLDSQLGAIRGVSLAEYRLLRALADAPSSWASRVDLAHAVGLTPSGVTRALQPLEKLGLISTAKSKRDARLTLASLTPAGQELVNDASAVVNDTMESLLQRSPRVSGQLDQLLAMLDELSR
jgi:DNA-binding MarR family transcriptional regulator